jgi:hypothetical protein
MKFPRRQFLHLAAGAAMLPAMSRISSALDYPTRPVRMIVKFAPAELFAHEVYRPGRRSASTSSTFPTTAQARRSPR